MKVIMISTDRKIFETGSNVRSRITSYGALFDELHVIVYSKSNIAFQKEHILPNIFIYGTHSYSKLLYVWGAIKLAKRIIKKSATGVIGWVVSAQDPFETGIAGVRLSKHFNIPLQIQIHTDFLSPHFKKQSRLNRIRLVLAEKTLREADCIRVVSKRIKQSVEMKYRNVVSSVVLPIFIDITKIRDAKPAFNLHEKYPQFDFIVLINSRLEPEKNVQLAVEAFRDVVAKNKNAGLVIVGDGSEKEKLEQLSDTLQISANVKFEGWQTDVVAYYKTADLFLNTSNYEGYGLTLIEAAEARCPIVTTNVGVVGEVLNESNVFVCSVGDRDCIEKKIVSAIHNRDVLENLANKAFIDTQTTLLKNPEFYAKQYKEALETCGIKSGI